MIETNEKKYANSRIPRVSKDTIDIFIRDLRKRFDESEDSIMEWSSELVDKLNKGNSDLDYLMDSMIEIMKRNRASKGEIVAFKVSMMSTLYVSHAQEELNKLEKIYKR